jgi:hypothetical protein
MFYYITHPLKWFREKRLDAAVCKTGKHFDHQHIHLQNLRFDIRGNITHCIQGNWYSVIYYYYISKCPTSINIDIPIWELHKNILKPYILLWKGYSQISIIYLIYRINLWQFDKLLSWCIIKYRGSNKNFSFNSWPSNIHSCGYTNVEKPSKNL